MTDANRAAHGRCGAWETASGRHGHGRRGGRRWAALMAWRLMAARRRRWMAAQQRGGGQPWGGMPPRAAQPGWRSRPDARRAPEGPATVSLPRPGDITWI
jgi:hypothetical protein